MQNSESSSSRLVSDQYVVVAGCPVIEGSKEFAGRRKNSCHSPEASGRGHQKQWWQALMAIVLTIMIGSCGGNDSKYPRVEISTKQGDIVIELYPDKAPKSVAAFLSYIEKGLYKNASFYRVLNDDNQPSNAPKAAVIQGGLYRSRNRPELPGIPHETTKQTGIQHKDGAVSLARLEPGSATSEFFICLGDQPGFDFGGANNPDGLGYAAFGRVIKGMDIVRRIHNMPENDQYFDPPVSIFNIEKL